MPPRPNRDLGRGVAAAGAFWGVGAWGWSNRALGAAVTSGGACDDAVSHLRDPATGKDVYLIGTAHISNASAQVRGCFAHIWVRSGG
jgi:hypothetical protein